MIVSTTLPGRPKGGGRPCFPEPIAQLARALHVQRRAKRHAAIRRFLADPGRLDSVLPGLSRQRPGPGNDRLRALRYEARDLGAHLLTIDADALQAALVAQRIRCWQALHGR